MKRCIIFCAGDCAQPVFFPKARDLVIAADGGVGHVRSFGIGADLILGDFDSLGYIPQGAQVFPAEKDDTDAMLAVRKGLEAGCREFYLYGCLDGPRLDHTLAAFQTLQYLTDHGARGYLIGLGYMATVICNEAVAFSPEASGILSLFCLGPDARGVTLRGLHYPLEDGTLTSGFPLGVSNHFTGRAASVTVGQGSLLCLYDVKNGFPTGRVPAEKQRRNLHG